MLTSALERRPLTVQEFLRIVDAGVLGEDERIELIEGELIQMPPIGGAHMQAVNRLNLLLGEALRRQAVVSVQNAIALPPRSVPQPDLALLTPASLARPEVPGVADILLVIEVADSTVSRDRDVKIPLYARHGVREVWLVHLPRKVVQVFRKPGPEGYRELFERSAVDRLAPEALPDAAIELAAVFG